MHRAMSRPIKSGIAAFALFALHCGLSVPALAGGSMLDEDDHHAYYFGSVKDANGAAVVNAKVKMQTKALTIMTQSNDIGAYKLPVVGATVNPDELSISCSKDGYRQLDVIRRSGPGGDGKEPVEIDCTLQHE
jgi:hypothetical protein